MKKFLAAVLFTCLAVLGFSQANNSNLSLSASDLYFVRGDENGPNPSAKGIHLYIKKNSAIQSVMLVESHNLPGRKETSYAYRALEYNKINGDELRYLNGKLLQDKDSRYSLISSTPEKNEALGECFHIYIPETVEYGYIWAEKHAIVSIEDEDFFYIRTFAKKYCDYSGSFMDNECVFPKYTPVKESLQSQSQNVQTISVSDEGYVGEEQPEVQPEMAQVEEHQPQTGHQRREEPVDAELVALDEFANVSGGEDWEKVTDDMLDLTDEEPPVEKVYVSEAEKSFNQIAREGGGLVSYTFGTKELSDNMIKSLEKCRNYEKTEIVFALDATGSMDDDFYELLNGWLPRLREQVESFTDIRLGLLLYKDYRDDYNYEGLPVKYFGFAETIDQLEEWIRGANVDGGGDTPEAVYEALYSSIKFFDWSADAYKKIILIGDAQPHDSPRGDPAINKTNVVAMAKENNIVFDCIIIMKESDRAYFETAVGTESTAGDGGTEGTAPETEGTTLVTEGTTLVTEGTALETEGTALETEGTAPAATESEAEKKEPPVESEAESSDDSTFIITSSPVDALLESVDTIEK